MPASGRLQGVLKCRWKTVSCISTDIRDLIFCWSFIRRCTCSLWTILLTNSIKFAETTEDAYETLSRNKYRFFGNWFESVKPFLEQLADELKFKQLNNQYYFGTERAISLLKRLKWLKNRYKISSWRLQQTEWLNIWLRTTTLRCLMR